MAASILAAAYHMLKVRTIYQDLGRNYFKRHSNETQKRYSVKRLAELGYAAQLTPISA